MAHILSRIFCQLDIVGASLASRVMTRTRPRIVMGAHLIGMDSAEGLPSWDTTRQAVDGEERFRLDPSHATWPFFDVDRPFMILLNLAVGGRFLLSVCAAVT